VVAVNGAVVVQPFVAITIARRVGPQISAGWGRERVRITAVRGKPAHRSMGVLVK